MRAVIFSQAKNYAVITPCGKVNRVTDLIYVRVDRPNVAQRLHATIGCDQSYRHATKITFYHFSTGRSPRKRANSNTSCAPALRRSRTCRTPTPRQSHASTTGRPSAWDVGAGPEPALYPVMSFLPRRSVSARWYRYGKALIPLMVVRVGRLPCRRHSLGDVHQLPRGGTLGHFAWFSACL